MAENTTGVPVPSRLILLILAYNYIKGRRKVASFFPISHVKLLEVVGSRSTSPPCVHETLAIGGKKERPISTTCYLENLFRCSKQPLFCKNRASDRPDDARLRYRVHILIPTSKPLHALGCLAEF